MAYDRCRERGAGEFWGTDEAVAQRERALAAWNISEPLRRSAILDFKRI
jgi:hypothetical protein